MLHPYSREFDLLVNIYDGYVGDGLVSEMDTEYLHD